MKFATFESTYKPLPIETYERTGQELEAKYYKNREDSSQLRQYMSKLQVEDRNIGHLAKATTDVENMFDQIDGKWHRAGNILFNAKERIIQDKALNASIEDYEPYLAQKTEQQKRFEEGKIDQAALNAYYINDKRYNDKAIEIDENGQAKNRWATPTPISKVDIEKKVTDLVQLLNQHKSSLAVGATGQGSPLYEIYQANPRLEGYVTKYTASGNSPEKIAEAVRAWIDTTPEIKQYYNYINDATVFDAVTQRDENGRYLKDENGNFIQRDLTAKDFRDIGVYVADDWNTISNFTTVALPGGILTQIPVENQSDNLKNTGLYKELIESGLSDREAMQKIYANTLTSMQTNKIINFGRQFGYSEYDSDVIKDEGYWFNKNLAQKKLDEAKIYSTLIGKAPMYSKPDFSLKASHKQLNDLLLKQDSLTKGTPEYNQITAEIENLRITQQALRTGFEKNTPDGAQLINDQYSKILDKVPKKDKLLFMNKAQQVKDYISGKTTELGFVYNTKQGIGGARHLAQSVQDILDSARNSYDKGVEKAVQEGKVNLDINTYDFVDKDGAIAKIGENVGNYILERGNSFINLAALNKQGEKMTLRDYYTENNIDPAKYRAVAQFTDNFGKFVIRFVPRKDTIEPLEKDERIIIEPNPDNKTELMQEITDLIQNQSTGLSPEVNKWIYQTRSDALYSSVFGTLQDRRAIGRANNTTDQDFKEYYLPNVPLSRTDPSLLGEFKVTFNDDNSISLYQLGKNGELALKTTRNTINEIQDFLFNQYIK